MSRGDLRSSWEVSAMCRGWLGYSRILSSSCRPGFLAHSAGIRRWYPILKPWAWRFEPSICGAFECWCAASLFPRHTSLFRRPAIDACRIVTPVRGLR